MKQININFQNRKIQKIRFSYCINLAGIFVKRMNLGKGTILRIEMLEDQSLRMTPVSGNSHEPQELEANTPIRSEEMC
jgi:hypothetical protein